MLVRSLPLALLLVWPATGLTADKLTELSAEIAKQPANVALLLRRAEIQDQNERMESDIARYRDLETLLRKTLVTAERSSEELREQARREADVVLAEARAEARTITQQAHSERDHLRAEASRIRALLRSALEVSDELNGDDESAEAA